MRKDRKYQELAEENASLRERIKELEVADRKYKKTEESLRKSEEQYRILAENSPSMIYLLDLSGNILFVNQRSAAQFRSEPHEIIGRNIGDIFPRHIAEGHMQTITAVGKSGETVHRELIEPFPTGELWIDARLVPVWDKEKSTVVAVLGISHDITDTKRAEEALRASEAMSRRLALESAFLADIGRVISSTLNIEEVYGYFAEKVRSIIPFDRIAITIINRENNTVKNAYVEGLELSIRMKNSISPLAGTVSEEVMRSKQSLLIQGEGEPLWNENFDRFESLRDVYQQGFRSQLSVPLISNDVVIGVMHYHSMSADAYAEYEMLLAERVANQIAGAIANAELFTEQKRSEEAIKELALRDLLTDFYNRRGFYIVAEQQLHVAIREERHAFLTFIDCNELKFINDTYGHAEGDRALVDTAEIIRRSFRRADIVGRLGGDEFAVLSTHNSGSLADVLSERIRQNLGKFNAQGSRPYRLDISWGVAVNHPEAPLSLEELLSKADAIMYQHKKANRRI